MLLSFFWSICQLKADISYANKGFNLLPAFQGSGIRLYCLGFDKLTHHGNPLRGPFQSGLGLALLQQIHQPFLKVFIAQLFFFL